jgi:signal transduction histidine kinase
MYNVTKFTFLNQNSMKIKTRLIISFSVLTALIILPNIYSFYGMIKGDKTFANMTQALDASSVRLTTIMVAFTDMRVEASRMGMFIAKHDKDTTKIISTTKFFAADEKAKEHIQYLSTLSPKHNAFAVQLEGHRKKFNDTYKEMVAYAHNQTDHPYLDKMNIFIEIHDSVNTVSKSTLTFLNGIVANEEKLALDRRVAAKKYLITLIFIGIIISLIATVTTMKSLLHPLEKVTEATKKIRDGDYNFRLKLNRKDEFGQLGKSFNRMLDELDQAKFVENQKQELESLNAELKVKNDSLDSFVYRVSHDLKAPIINISSLLTLVKKKVSAEDKFLNQTLGFIDDSVKKLQNTIYDLLEVSRIERNLQGEMVEVDLNDMITDIHTEFGELIRSNEAVIETDFTEGGSMVDFAKANMKSILSNIISNGIKYKSPLRKPVIKLTTTMEGDFLKLKIEDNGIGIDLNRHGENLFKMFSRFHSHVEGSGVGLYIVHKLITENGGKIKLDSDLSKGSTFNIYFKTSKKPAYV